MMIEIMATLFSMSGLTDFSTSIAITLVFLILVVMAITLAISALLEALTAGIFALWENSRLRTLVSGKHHETDSGKNQ